ncbi:hypothetical protein FRB99_005322 [Tulasnella sp. 403]|nr:hypothetical protein FRB99_005322 [Tulasnella sp. 403]
MNSPLSLSSPPGRNSKLWVTTRPNWAPPLDTTDDRDPTLPPRPLPNSYWATPTLLASEYPGGYTPNTAAMRLEALLDVGIRDFLDLTESKELVPYAGILEEVVERRGGRVQIMGPLAGNAPSVLGSASLSMTLPPASSEWQVDPGEWTVRLGRFPIRDYDVPTPAALFSILSALSASQDQNRRSVVHCAGGIGRTGMIVGCWLVHAGYVHDDTEDRDPADKVVTKTAGENALTYLRKKWAGVDKSWRAPETPENERQVDVVRTFRPLASGREAPR